MKKLTFILFVMLALVGMKANAAMYIVGGNPFGNWNPGGGVEMTLGNDGLYTYTATISGTVYFVFADGLSSDWTVFNTDYRYGPADGDTKVTVDNWVDTQKAGDHGAYFFQGTGEDYVFTFDPAYDRFKIEGYVAPIVITSYTVVGPKEAFGTEWDPTNEANDMTLGDDGLYTWTKQNVEIATDDFEYKIVGNHDWGIEWPQGMANFHEYPTSYGVYDVTITFNPVTEEATCTLDWVSELPDLNTVYIFGDVNNFNAAGGWDPTQGVELTYSNGIFTGEITTTPQEGHETCYIGFTSKLADPDSETPWDDIARYRFGPASNGDFIMVYDLLGTWIALAPYGTYSAIAIPEGTWTITIDLENRFFKIEGEWNHYMGEVYVLGEVNGKSFAPNDGVIMSRGNNYTYRVNIHTEGENEGYSYFNFSTNLAENDAENGGWEEITNSRMGVITADGEPLLVTEDMLGEKLNLMMSGEPTSVKVPAGQWILALSVDNMNLVIEDARGDVNRDGFIDIADVTALIGIVLKKADFPAEADVNSDGEATIADVTSLISRVLSGHW